MSFESYLNIVRKTINLEDRSVGGASLPCHTKAKATQRLSN